ncbi:hypothetical protein BBBOND_0300680 [Babesia bigemina]|uniref:Transmembrane protein n=1 Tax=Babesia bigemina TaxID=5866 RepID=A0A061D6I0_BABBI|nr:hypothetical protein BBBOND_0300680 [Babesia bigemina]CDR96163.1 hypothetical protein BBBOND_0300680 [Babesia bigemina]|eukprot:XP_012768349.1 hypothetical protein BBBOND_0300680 [Babesia bigemina]
MTQQGYNKTVCGLLLHIQLLACSILALFGVAAVANRDVITCGVAFLSAALIASVCVTLNNLTVICNCIGQVLIGIGLLYINYHSLHQAHPWITLVRYSTVISVFFAISSISVVCSVALLNLHGSKQTSLDENLFNGAASAFVTFEEYRAETYSCDEDPLLNTDTSIEIRTDNEFMSGGGDREDGQLTKGPEMAFSKEINTNMWDWVTVDDSNADDNDSSQQTQVINNSVLPQTDGNCPMYSSFDATFTVREPLLASDLSSQQSAVDYGVENKHVDITGNRSSNYTSGTDFWGSNVPNSHENNAGINTFLESEAMAENRLESLGPVMPAPLRNEDWKLSPRNPHSAIAWGGSIASRSNYVDIATANDPPMHHSLNSPRGYLQRADDTAITGQTLISSPEEAHIPTAGLQCIPVRDGSRLVLHRKELVSSSEESIVSKANVNTARYNLISAGDSLLSENVVGKQPFKYGVEFMSDSRYSEV